MFIEVLKLAVIVVQILLNREEYRMEIKEVLTALAAIAQESRLAVFRLLVQNAPDGVAASKIAKQLSISPSSLSFHLKELIHAKLITSRCEGRFVIYSADVPVMNRLLAYLTKHCCGGMPCGVRDRPGQENGELRSHPAA